MKLRVTNQVGHKLGSLQLGPPHKLAIGSFIT